MVGSVFVVLEGGSQFGNGRAPFPALLVLPRCPHRALPTGLSCVPPCLLCSLSEASTGPVQLGSRPGSFVTRVGSGGDSPQAWVQRSEGQVFQNMRASGLT